MTGTMPNNGSYRVSTGLHNNTVAIPQGVRDGTGYIWYWDENHIASNIKSGVSVGGVTGTCTPIVSGPGEQLIIKAKGNTWYQAGPAYNKTAEIRINYAGTIRVKIKMYSNYNGEWTYAQVYKNGVAIGIQRSVNTNVETTFSEDFTVVSGDLIQVYQGGPNTGAVSELGIYGAVLPLATVTLTQ